MNLVIWWIPDLTITLKQKHAFMKIPFSTGISVAGMPYLRWKMVLFKYTPSTVSKLEQTGTGATGNQGSGFGKLKG